MKSMEGSPISSSSTIHRKKYVDILFSFVHRYIDDIFMTTNETIDEINVQLEKAKIRDMNIKIDPTIDTRVHFLDVTIANENGQLRTSIYHKPTAEPYILPYTSDHPRHTHRNIPYTALLRAARICSNVDDFALECIRIDISLLLNNYPPHFITKQFNRFFHFNNAMSVSDTMNTRLYSRLHENLLYEPTRREKQLQTMLHDPVRAPTVLQAKIWDRQLMFPRYLFDSALSTTFQKHFNKWWKENYAITGSPVEQVRVRLVPNTNPTLETYFIHKKPARELLTRIET